MKKEFHSYEEWLACTTEYFNDQVYFKIRDIISKMTEVSDSDYFDEFINKNGRDILDGDIKNNSNSKEFAAIMDDATYITAFNVCRRIVDILETDYENQVHKDLINNPKD